MKSDPQLREDVRKAQARIAQLEEKLQQAEASERIKEVIVEKRVPVDVERVVEKTVTVYTDRPVERLVKVHVPEYQDRPETLAELTAAKKAIADLQARPPEVIEKRVVETETVERIVEVEKLVYVDRPIEKIVERVIEKSVPVETRVEVVRPDPATTRALAKATKELVKLKARPAKREIVERLVTVGHDELLALVKKLQAELAEIKQEGS